jgi:hypothetical protein
MLLDAREVVGQRNARKLILLRIEDVTERRAAEREVAQLLRRRSCSIRLACHPVSEAGGSEHTNNSDQFRPQGRSGWAFRAQPVPSQTMHGSVMGFVRHFRDL